MTTRLPVGYTSKSRLTGVSIFAFWAQRIYISGLVSKHVSDVMLGIDWLSAQGLIWDFATGEIVLNGLPYRLVSSKDREYTVGE